MPQTLTTVSSDTHAFCKDLFAKWPNKSQLIGQVAATLSGEAQAEFLSLAPADAGHMVFCLLVAAPEEPAAREAMLRGWMKRLSTLRQDLPDGYTERRLHYVRG